MIMNAPQTIKIIFSLNPINFEIYRIKRKNNFVLNNFKNLVISIEINF